MAFFKINDLDIIDYLDREGFAWSENDLDSSEAGRTLDGMMHRGKVASKYRIEVKLVAVDRNTVDRIFYILRNEYITVKTDIIPGQQVFTMYNSTRSGGISIITTDGQVKYTEVSFKMIER